MKQVIIFLIAISLNTVLRGQSMPNIDMKQYMSAKTNTAKGRILMGVKLEGGYIEKISFWLNQLNHFKEQNDVNGMNYSQLLIGRNYNGYSEYNLALKYLLPALRGFESRNDVYGIILSNMATFTAFAYSGHSDEALSYINKCTSVAKSYPDTSLVALVLMNGADCLVRMNLPDLAIPRLQEAVKIFYEFKDTLNVAAALATFGQSYIAKKNYEIAKPYLLQSLQYSKLFNQKYFMTYIAIDLSHLFFEQTQFDSSLAYAREALSYAGKNEPLGSMHAFELMYKNYEKLDRNDSAFKYFRMATIAKDSIFTTEKTRSIQIMDFQEKIRLQELAIENEKAELRRKQNLQYVLIALGIVVFIMLFLLLSQSIIIQPKIIKYLGVIVLLIVFEFFNLLLHPFLERITHHSPLLILAGLVFIASLLVPLHHRAEKLIIKKLLEKNNKIRLLTANKAELNSGKAVI